MSQTSEALERADASKWGGGRGPSRAQRARLWARPIGIAVGAAALSVGSVALGRLDLGLWGPLVIAAHAARGVLIGLLAFPIGELALGLAHGASARGSARVAGASLKASAWLAAGVAAAPLIALAGALGHAARLFAARGGAGSAWLGAPERWVERAMRIHNEKLPLLRAREFGPLAAWSEARAAASLGLGDFVSPIRLLRAMRAWELSPFDPGWVVVSGKKAGPKGQGRPESTLIGVARSMAPVAEPGDFWPEAGALEAALERSALRRAAPATSQEALRGAKAGGLRL